MRSYGTLERLQALSTGYFRLNWVIAYQAVASALVLIPAGRLTVSSAAFWVVVGWTAVSILISSQAFWPIATGKGWPKVVGIIPSLLISAALPLWLYLGPGEMWAAVVCFASALCVIVAVAWMATATFTRYGARISTVSLREQKSMVEEAIERRRLEDAHGHLPPTPENLFSGYELQ